MANAKKCDRCGRLYEIPKKAYPYTVSVKRTYNDTFLLSDICPECAEMLKNWWEGNHDKPT